MKGFILKPHEAQALAAGKPVVIWRVCKPQPTMILDGVARIPNKRRKHEWTHPDGSPRYPTKEATIPFPIGVPLFGKETWSPEGVGPGGWGNWKTGEHCKVYYRADFTPDSSTWSRVWMSSPQMREWASRITLTLSDVKVRRPCDVTEEEAKAMGFIGGHGSIPNYPFSATPREHWKAQWGWPEPKTDWSLYHFTALATPQPKEP